MSIYSRRAAALAAALLFCSASARLFAADPAAPDPAQPPPPPGESQVPPSFSFDLGTPSGAAPSAPSAPPAAPDPRGKKAKSGTTNRKKTGDAAAARAGKSGYADIAGVFDGRPAETISLPRAIELALENNLDAKYEHTGIGIQRAQVKFAAAAFDPTFVMSAEHQEVREAQDTNSPVGVEQVNNQQTFQTELNNSALSLNSQLLTAQSSALSLVAQAQAAASNLASLNQQLNALGEKPLTISNLSAVNPELLRVTPLVTPNLNQIVILDQVNTQATMGLQGKTSIGTRYAFSVGINNFRDTFTGNTAPVITLDQPTALLQVQQPLLKNFGKDANLSDLRSAKINAKVQTLTWKQAVSTSIQGVMSAYYDMLAALKDIQVRQDAINADSKLVELYRRRVELGFGSPFDISQAEVAVSTDREALLVSKNNFLERQFALKRLIVSRFNRDDGRLYFPEPATPDLVQPVAGRAQLLHIAFENRYDFRATLLNADLQDVRLKYAKNQLLPELDLIASYGFDGLDTGVASSTDNLFSGHQPQWTLGFQFQMPLGNRAARAQYAAFRAQKEQAIIRIQQSEIAVGVDVDTVISRIETARQRVEAARKTRLGEEAIRIAYRRLEEGQISAYDITEQQRRLYDARSRELGAQAELNKSVTLLWQVTGTVLSHQHILFDEPSAYYTPPPDIRDASAAPPSNVRDAASTTPRNRH